MARVLKLFLLVPMVPLMFVELAFAVIEAIIATISGVLSVIKVWISNDYPYYKWLQRDLADCESILDLGCGSSSPLLKIGVGKKTDAVDIFEPYIKMHNKAGDYRSCVLADILTMPLIPELEKQYDAVVVCDVLEHLPKDKVYEIGLFNSIERIARKRVILFTPNSFVENDLVDDDPYQAHVSSWWPDDYRAMGYKVVGSTGLRWLLGKGSLPEYKPSTLFQILALLAQPLVYRYPRIAWHSYAVKEIKCTQQKSS